MLKIIALKTNLGYYIGKDEEYGTSLSYYYFDGEKAEPTFDRNWFFITKIPEKVEMSRTQPDINFRYEIIDEKLVNENIPKTFGMDVSELDEDGDRYWKPEYAHLKSLYKLVSDKQLPIMETVEFSFKIVLELEIDKINEPHKFSYPIKVRYDDRFLTERDIQHRLIDKILFPEILKHETPAMFTSKQVYDIIRFHIKQNIDPKYAKITSDYDFCFEVQKVIKLSNPFSRETEVLKSNGNSYRPQRFQKTYVADRKVKLFEMTNSQDKYKGYTIIEGITADNEIELKEKMDQMLKDIIEFINDPVVDCPNCSGMGVLFRNK